MHEKLGHTVSRSPVTCEWGLLPHFLWHHLILAISVYEKHNEAIQECRLFVWLMSVTEVGFEENTDLTWFTYNSFLLDLLVCEWQTHDQQWQDINNELKVRNTVYWHGHTYFS